MDACRGAEVEDVQSWTRRTLLTLQTPRGPLAFTDASHVSIPVRLLALPHATSPVTRPIIFSKAKNPNRLTRTPLPAMEKKNAPAAVAPEPVASEPVASEPIAAEPVASEAVAAELVASEGGASKRGASVNWASLKADGPLHKIGNCLLANPFVDNLFQVIQETLDDSLRDEE